MQGGFSLLRVRGEQPKQGQNSVNKEKTGEFLNEIRRFFKIMITEFLLITYSFLRFCDRNYRLTELCESVYPAA